MTCVNQRDASPTQDLSNEFIHISSSLEMNNTFVYSKSDPDNLVTVPCSHRVGVYM